MGQDQQDRAQGLPAADVTADAKVRAQIKKLQDDGYGHYPVCVAKTQASITVHAAVRGAPTDHVVNIREVRLAGGRRVRGDDLRRHHDHAGAAQGSRGGEDRPGRRQGRRAVLIGRCWTKSPLSVLDRPAEDHRRQHHPVGRQRGGDRAGARSLPPKSAEGGDLLGLGRRGGDADHPHGLRGGAAHAAVAEADRRLAAALLDRGQAAHPEEGDEDIDASDNLIAAIKTILIADLVMSIDNVIAVAAAGGSLTLLVLGLAISIPLVIFGSTLLLHLMERWPVIITIGGGLLGFVAGEMLVTDPALKDWLAGIGVTFDGEKPKVGGAEPGAHLRRDRRCHRYRRRNVDRQAKGHGGECTKAAVEASNGAVKAEAAKS